MLVFVYGTLTDRERVESVLGGGSAGGDGSGGDAAGSADETVDSDALERETLEYSFRAPATLEGCRRIDGRYPTLAPGGSVEGRILAVGENGLEALDRYEGVESGLYVRVPVPLADGEGRAWTYVGDPDRLGVGDAVTWPDDAVSNEATFEERVRSYVAERCVVRR